MSADVRELARACLLAGFVGPDLPAWLAAELDAGLGGVTLFASNVAGGAALIETITSRRPGAVVAIDEEGGEVSRLDAAGGSREIGAAALGWVDDVALTEAVHARLGARLGELGVTVDLAPVADVNSDPRNPVIGVRSFGSDPALVARHVAAAVRGIQSAGVAACAKHFPGHGDTATDSHLALPRIGRSAAELDAVELPPFRAALAAGTRAVMTGHLLVPALDAGAPASLSPAITTGLLREDLGFPGAVITDALEMAGALFAGAGADGDVETGLVEAAVAALVAGADTLCLGAQEWPGAVARIPDAVALAVEQGRLSTARLQQAAQRSAGLGSPPSTARPAGDGDDGADRAIEILGRLPALRDPVVVEYHTASSIASGELGWSLGALLPGARTVALGPEDPLDAALAADPAHPLVLVVRDPARHPAQRAALARVAGTPTVVVDVGWPDSGPVATATLRTRGTAPPLLAAAARRLTSSPDREGSDA